MKKIIFLAFFCLQTLVNANNTFYDKVLIDTDKIFGDNIADSMEAYQDQNIKTRGAACVDQQDCTNHYNDVMDVFIERVKINLKQQEKRWNETTPEAKKQKEKMAILPVQQARMLALEQAKLEKLKEIRFNIEKQINLTQKQMNMLKLRNDVNLLKN